MGGGKRRLEKKDLGSSRDFVATVPMGLGFTLPETNMETQKGPYKDYSLSKRGLYGISMLPWGSVGSSRDTGATVRMRSTQKAWVPGRLCGDAGRRSRLTSQQTAGLLLRNLD